MANNRIQKEERFAMNTSENLVTEVSTSEEVAGYVTEEGIRERAYELYEQRGGENGLDVEDWLAAEAELEHSAVA